MKIYRTCQRTCTSARGMLFLVALAFGSALFIAATINRSGSTAKFPIDSEAGTSSKYQPRLDEDLSGFSILGQMVRGWSRTATLEEVRDVWADTGTRAIALIDGELAESQDMAIKIKCASYMAKVSILNSRGDTKNAYRVLQEVRQLIESDETQSRELLYTAIFMQGVISLRRGENENCIMCRGESSCILPISPAAVHTNPEGSRQAIAHFTEYLQEFPGDLGVRWLLNLAHMTLGEYPSKVDRRYLLPLDNYFRKSEFDIGKFRDIGHLVGVNRFNQAGGSIMEDFDNDGRLDIVTTSMDPTCPMCLMHNSGDGTFEDRSIEAGVTDQLGGLNCVQTDYNNDGLKDIFIARGAWLKFAIRPTLLRNDGHGKFTDVTEAAGLLEPANSISATWADYDNDGWLDLFVCCEEQANRLYRNLGNGTFEEVARKVGLYKSPGHCKGAAWIDFDNDGYPDLFQNYISSERARLFHNRRDGTFEDVTGQQGIDGPTMGFSCWAWDYDNDGWLDIFATCYDRSVQDVVKGLLGQPHKRAGNRLFRNKEGRGFEDVTKEAGLNLVFATMGSNFGDFDNDGFLDMYLGTGEPNLTMLVPNRMFRNVAGKRFVEITAGSGTGNLQKGHGVSCGDWDRDGNTDIFIEMGGAVDGDKYHNVLFQNPGHDNRWLTVKLEGKKTNRAAIGARIKVVTAGKTPQTFFRHVTSGSSFGGSPLQQTIGLAQADRIASLEIYWPTSRTTQVFRDLAVNQAISITELADDFERLDWKPIPVPKSDPAARMTTTKR